MRIRIANGAGSLLPRTSTGKEIGLDAHPFIERIRSREAVIGVIGLGYVGLPLAMEFAKAGFKVLGFDTDQGKADALNRGKSYIHHISSDGIRALVDGGLLEATGDFSRSGEPDALLICVPTPLTAHHAPDLSYIEST